MTCSKKVLVIGKNSYIGNYFWQWMQEKYPEYEINMVSSRGGQWKKENFGLYDTVMDVAGIAHVQAKEGEEALYYTINRDLALELAKKAREEGTSQFIYLSSMIVYGESNVKNADIRITAETLPKPEGFYGKSKLEAEEGLLDLQNENFRVLIVRPPMVYGKGSKGNYPKLAAFAKKTKLFPAVDNQRSMIYIENLCEFLRLMIKNREAGIMHPQNKEYINTTDLVKNIALVSGRKVVAIKIFNPLLRFFARRVNMINKVFGTMTYTKEMSYYKEEYCLVDMKESIKRTEG